MSVNIRDIARETNLSIATISRVLHNKSNVREKTKKKVLATMQRLNYDPQETIPLMKKVRTHSLGLVIPHFTMQSNPFYSRSVIKFKEITNAQGYQSILYSVEEIVQKTIKEFQNGRAGLIAEGLVVFCPHQNWDRYLKILQDWKVPTVLVRRETRVPGVPVLMDDDYKGARLALDHLYNLGHRRIIHIGYTMEGYVQERIQAYQDFINEHSMPQDLLLLVNGLSEEERVQWIEEKMTVAEPPTAIFCYSDFHAILTIKKLKKLGIKVPEDCAVIGYNNGYEAELFSPAITSVDIPVEQMISMGIDLISKQIQGMETESVSIKFTNKLIVRESCGASL